MSENDRLTVRERVLKVIDANQQKIKEYDGPFALTYSGLSVETGVGREVVCAALSTMMRHGELVFVQRHVPGSRSRRRLYVRPDNVTLADQHKSDWAKLHSEIQRMTSRLRNLEGIAERLCDTTANSKGRR